MFVVVLVVVKLILDYVSRFKGAYTAILFRGESRFRNREKYLSINIYVCIIYLNQGALIQRKKIMDPTF